MFETKVLLNGIDKVKKFVNDIQPITCDMDLLSGRYVIDARSIMGIFSLNLSKPIDFHAHTESQVEIDKIKMILKDYMA